MDTPKIVTDIDRFPIYEEYVAHFSHDRGAASGPSQHSAPASRYVWVPRRCCIQDWVLSVYVCRWSRTVYEVALFLAEDHVDYERGAAAKAGLMFLLSDAYHQTGRMELTFVGPCSGAATMETGHERDIPRAILALCEHLGMQLAVEVDARGPQKRTVLQHESGEALYARITGLSDRAVNALTNRSVDLVKACFAIQRGLWSKSQAELIAVHAHAPERVFAGDASTERRVQHMHDLLLLRVAVLGERFEALCGPVHGGEGQVVTSEWSNDGRLVLSLAKPVEWTDEGRTIQIPAKTKSTAMLVARDAAGYGQFAEQDIAAAAASEEPRVVVVTRDFEWMPEASRRERLAQAAKLHLAVVQVFDTIGELDAEIDQRLSRVASTKRGAPERPD